MLNLPYKPIIALTLKPAEDQEEIISDQEAIENGYKETVDGIRIAKDINWEIWLEPLNFVLRVNSRNYYFSSFEQLLRVIANNRIKYWLTQEKWNRIDIAMEQVQIEISKTCEKLRNTMDYLLKKFSINSID